MADDTEVPHRPQGIFKRAFTVHFSTAQLASLSHQMADCQRVIEDLEDDKKKAAADFKTRLDTLDAQRREYAKAVRDGEGEIYIPCIWKPDPARPVEHCWNLETMEAIETRPLPKSARKGSEQLDLVTPSPAGGPDGNAPAAGSEPGADVLHVQFAPLPPCPGPAESAFGVCADDVVPSERFCARHMATLDEGARAAILDAVFERARIARLEAAARRREAKLMSEEEEEAAQAERIRRNLAVACPTCNAASGAACVDEQQAPREDFHIDRVTAGEKAAAGVQSSAWKPLAPGTVEELHRAATAGPPIVRIDEPGATAGPPAHEDAPPSTPGAPPASKAPAPSREPGEDDEDDAEPPSFDLARTEYSCSGCGADPGEVHRPTCDDADSTVPTVEEQMARIDKAAAAKANAADKPKKKPSGRPRKGK